MNKKFGLFYKNIYIAIDEQYKELNADIIIKPASKAYYQCTSLLYRDSGEINYEDKSKNMWKSGLEDYIKVNEQRFLDCDISYQSSRFQIYLFKK